MRVNPSSLISSLNFHPSTNQGENVSESDNMPVVYTPTEDDTPNQETATEPSANPEPIEVSPTPDENEPELNAAPVSGVPDDQAAVPSGPVSAAPSPGAVSEGTPEQTDNSERPEDGPQDVSQDPSVVPSDDEDQSGNV